jgi:hypothetical protein
MLPAAPDHRLEGVRTTTEAAMTTRTLFRWAAAAIMLSGVSMTVGGAIHPPVDPASITTPRWAVAHTLWWIGTVTGMIGLTGLYLRQHGELGVLGFVGVALAWTGTAVLSGAMFFEAIVVPTLLARAPELIEAFPRGEGWGAFISGVLASGLLLGVGFVLLGIAIVRAAMLPRWAAVLAVVGGVTQGISFLLPRPVAALGGIAFGVGLVGLGYGLWTSVGEVRTQRVTAGEPSVAS